MNHRNNRRSEATRKKIKQSLIQMLHEQPLNKITVHALCETADINRSTFYNHYDCPETVIKSIERDFLTGLDKHMDGFRVTAETPDSLIVVLTLILEYLKENKDICFLLQTQSLAPFFRRSVFRNVFSSYVVNHPLFKRYEGKTLEYVQIFLLYGCGHCIDRWLKDGCDSKPQEIAELLSQFLLKF